MADYYPLLSKAVAALDPNTPEARSAVYDRARAALGRQLASMEPAVSPAVAERELGALAAVIERIEREHGGAPPAMPAEPPPRSEAIARPQARGLRETRIPEPASAPLRPQVARRETKRSRKPWVAVGAAVGFMVVMAIATLAFLRRNEPPAMAARPGPAPARQAAAAPPAKFEERVTPGGGESSPRQQASAQPAPQSPANPAPSQPATQPPARPADPPRAGEAPTSMTAPASPSPAAVVANRMLLVLEGKDEPQKVDVRQGSVVWRTDTVSGGQGQSLQSAIRGLVDVPDSRLRAEITIQRNRDPAFPASHTIQVQFSSLGVSEVGPIQNLSQIEFRQTENQPGYALAGQGIAVMQDLFLVALAQIEPAQSRNVEMMRSRPLIYLEFQAAGGRRGAMIIEKGVTGQQVFEDAFRAWQ
jgi:hypothetical protein